MKKKSLEEELTLNYQPGPFHARPIEVSSWDAPVAVLVLVLGILGVLKVMPGL